jgi:hypothetical protein
VHLLAGVEGAVDGAAGALRRPVPEGGDDVRLVDQRLVPLGGGLGIARLLEGSSDADDGEVPLARCSGSLGVDAARAAGDDRGAFR